MYDTIFATRTLYLALGSAKKPSPKIASEFAMNRHMQTNLGHEEIDFVLSFTRTRKIGREEISTAEKEEIGVSVWCMVWCIEWFMSDCMVYGMVHG